MANENEIRPGVDKRGSGDMSKYDRPPFVEAQVGLPDEGGAKPQPQKSDPKKNEGKVG